MKETKIGNSLSDIKVENNFTSAPVEQQSPEPVAKEVSEPVRELATTEPKTELEPVEPVAAEHAKPDLAAESARKAIEAEVRADNAERQLRELQPKPKELGERPKIADFDTLENYDKAVDDWNELRSEKKFNEGLTARQQHEQIAKLRMDVQVRAKESRIKHADFDAVVAPLAGVMDSIPVLSDFIARNSMGTEVAYELAKNPVILEQLKRQDHWAAGEQLINMAARLKAPKPVQVSDAPAPIKPVGSREVVKPNLVQLATHDINGYMALKKKQKLARMRAN
jgi:hypothetical protein